MDFLGSMVFFLPHLAGEAVSEEPLTVFSGNSVLTDSKDKERVISQYPYPKSEP